MGDHDVPRENNTEASRLETLGEQSRREASIYNNTVAEVRYRVVIVMGMKRFPCETTHQREHIAVYTLFSVHCSKLMHESKVGWTME